MGLEPTKAPCTTFTPGRAFNSEPALDLLEAQAAPDEKTGPLLGQRPLCFEESRSMSTYSPSGYQSDGVHHSKEDALTDRQFELLLEATYDMGSYQGLEARFIILAAGRLGLRAGEITHMRESWLDRRRNMIVVPPHQDCEKGKDGGIGGYCQQQAEQRLNHNPEMCLEEALAHSWEPKTSAAAREVPFDAHPRAELVVERYFDRFDRFQVSRSTLGRRVKKAADISGLDGRIYAHCLRATAASYFAARGLDVVALQSMFGWASLQTAHAYIRRSGENTARAIRDIQV